MELIIGVVFALPLYLAAGISVARWQYSTAVNADVPEDKRDELKSLEKKIGDLTHGRYCDTRYGYKCDCSYKAHEAKLREQINTLRPGAEPQMGTIVTWPGYLLKRAAFKVYTPRPKPEREPVVDDAQNGVNWESPHMAKVRAMAEDAERRRQRESDPLYQKLTESWDKVAQAYSDDFLSDEEKKMVADAQQRAQDFLNYNPDNPLDMTNSTGPE